MNDKELAVEIKNAFYEGFNSYSTPCNAYNTVDDAWEKSDAKQIFDSLISK